MRARGVWGGWSVGFEQKTNGEDKTEKRETTVMELSVIGADGTVKTASDSTSGEITAELTTKRFSHGDFLSPS